MTSSPYQQALYDWILQGEGSVCVIAVAGSGKTTTILEAINRYIPRSQSVRLFAFNKQIADVLKGRIHGGNVEASTYHSSGYRAILRHLHAKVETDRKKSWDLTRTVLDDLDRRTYGEELIKLLSLIKGNGLGAIKDLTPTAIDTLIDHHDLDFDWLIPPVRMTDAQLEKHLQNERARVRGLVVELLDASVRAAEEDFAWRIDFDDQLYMPLKWEIPLQQYDWVIVDEAQDTNAVQREFLKRSLKPGGRLICVGDPHQSIYGWRGASHDAIEQIRSEFSATTLPLSVCYRCSRLIVEKAKTLVGQIEPAPGAPEGVVASAADPGMLDKLTARDAILCRNNAPLVKQAYQLIAAGVPCQILGRDIGEGLKKLIDKLRAGTVEELESRLSEYRTRETKRYRQLHQESKAQGVEDRVSCLQTIIESLDREERTLGAVRDAIDGLFGDGSKPLLTLSTIHKAKGQEWPTVAIISGHLMPSKWATKDWQIQQEANIQYVAWTRAQDRLLLIDDKPEWLKQKEAKERGEDRREEREELWPSRR